jgi:DNA-binding FadR family transcriptional regulator
MNKTQSEYKSINEMLDYLNLQGAARALMLDIWALFQVFDDIEDGDKVDATEFDRALWAALVTLPSNEIYVRFSKEISSVMAVQIFKWRAATQAETSGNADERSFVWRAGYFDILMYVYGLVYGRDIATQKAADVMGRYIEKYNEYIKEFKS